MALKHYKKLLIIDIFIIYYIISIVINIGVFMSTVNSQQSTVNSQQSTVNSQQSTVLNFFYLYKSFFGIKHHKLKENYFLGVL